MKVQRRPPAFTISTEAAFNEAGVWVIGAHLRFHRRTSSQTRSETLGEARGALMAELIRQALRGRTLGANVIRVRLDSGGRVTEFGFDDRIPDVNLLS